MAKTVCGCLACEGWAKVHDAWVDAASAAATAAEEPLEPVVVCSRTGAHVPSWGPALMVTS